MNNQIHEEAAHWIVEFRTGDNDPATRKQFDAWIRKSPEHLRAYLEIAEIWQDASFVGQGANDLALDQLIADARMDDNLAVLANGMRHVQMAAASVSSPLQGSAAAPAPVRRPVTRQRFLAVAASILAMVTAGVWLHLNRDTYATAVGEQRSISLGDGSTIQLNSQSKVRVRYTSTERDVDLLHGQALFRVAKDEARPFIVRSDETRIRAVGTQFDVYRKNSGTVVTVVEGVVAVTAPSSAARAAGVEKSSAVLTAGKRITIPAKIDESKPIVTAADVQAATGWTRHQLIFKATPLATVAEEFNRYNERHIMIDCGAGCDFNISGVYSSTDPTLLIQFLREQPEFSVDDSGEAIVVRRQ